jgi:hypothetical protein
MAPFTSDDSRRRRGANVDTGTGGRTHWVTKGGGEPVRHLVIFAAPVVGCSGPGWGCARPLAWQARDAAA